MIGCQMSMEKQEKEWQSVIWRGMVLEGFEFCQMRQVNLAWHLEGTAVFSYEENPCLLNYRVICDSNWRTNSAKIQGWVGNCRVETWIVVETGQNWWLNGKEISGTKGCVDLDLNFSPCTNTIAIRRLNLAVGEEAEIHAAWLKFPSFNLEPLAQRYHRLEDKIYRYESGDGRFKADLVVNQIGFITHYPGIWIAESFS
jgi:uncharacterized protein